MDIGNHFLIGVAIASFATKDPSNLIEAGLVATLPDLLNGIPSHLYLLKRKWPEIKKYGIGKAMRIGGVERWKEIPLHFRYLYQSLHSIWFVIALSLIFYLAGKSIFILPLASHLALDLFLHKEVKDLEWITSIKPFYPFSKWQAPFFVNWWEKPIIPILFFLTALAIILLNLFFL